MIVIVDDDIAVRTSLRFMLEEEGYEVELFEKPEQVLTFVRSSEPELIIMDMNFTRDTSGKEGIELLQKVKIFTPQTPVILITGWGSIDLAVNGMRLGAFDFITKPWDNENILRSIKTALQLNLNNKSGVQVSSRYELDKSYDFSSIIGKHPKMCDVLQMVGQVAATDASVLITGESGTGKELIAEAIHRNSHRSNNHFVKVNLGGISTSLFESEMFGHKKGAFTDAHSDRQGRFELADKGTIFLDEIGELDLNSQVKLLRVLQEQTFESLGDSKTKRVDVRVVCATNKDLKKMVEKGEFREDLYYRINLININVPPLRERQDDISDLVSFFANKIYSNNDNIVEFEKEALEYLKRLPYPGNIRELKNLTERCVIISSGNTISKDDVLKNHTVSPIQQSCNPIESPGIMTISEMEEAMIRKAISAYNNNMTKVANALGISRSALYRRLEKYGVEY